MMMRVDFWISEFIGRQSLLKQKVAKLLVMRRAGGAGLPQTVLAPAVGRGGKDKRLSRF
jgi:hypothetical protein